uniref:Uncharacterized protein n=1 Tax=Biomphalaria glabrata TaxID=6526 RepID=A0A2C9KGY5_BIOGL
MVRCNLTKHEMPATVAAIQSYVSGKKYKKARSLKSYDYDKLKPHIIPSTKRNHLNELFCTLTLRHIGKSPEDVERHLKGKKYTRALARCKIWMCKLLLFFFVYKVLLLEFVCILNTLEYYSKLLIVMLSYLCYQISLLNFEAQKFE